ncbi:GNAT family N-acetyltransferase [Thermomonospora umbrina]|uniref:Acetyltransferase (GNAT) family protein n=1 Tax=Thermomonospora umbrina TaxID=111806 RepID=A0A3D9T2Q9_9ACTN|nr:GNAT family N-acetyltransferase [Thermomonospora umbrina]REE99054.1 acetyltransferase (GNAT) family protein [Thermomonospora umbrina]
MLVRDIVFHLEMTSPGGLRPARPAPRPVRLRESGPGSAAEFGQMICRVGRPHGWPALTWPTDRWRCHLDRPGVRAWIVEVDDREAGLVQLQAQPGGTAEIEFLGLAPEFVGLGLGGHLLTVTTRLAWEMDPVDGTPIHRVWVRTSSHDHANAKANYEARGFRLCHTEERRREFVVL